jgi:hypothetical protein
MNDRFEAPPPIIPVRPPTVAPPDAEDEGDRKKKKKKKKKDGDRMSVSRGVETMFRTSYRTHIDMSALADHKCNIMISINGIMVSIMLASISPKIDANPWLLVPSIILVGSCIVSMVYAILAARPRLSRRIITLEDVRRSAANVLFFGNFVSMREDDYLTAMSELVQDPERLYRTMMRDIYSLGGVLERKFRLLSISYTVFMFGLVVGAFAFLAVFAIVAIAGPPLGPAAPPPTQPF